MPACPRRCAQQLTQAFLALDKNTPEGKTILDLATRHALRPHEGRKLQGH